VSGRIANTNGLTGSAVSVVELVVVEFVVVEFVVDVLVLDEFVVVESSVKPSESLPASQARRKSNMLSNNKISLAKKYGKY
jgi:hypothetical protein